MTLARAVVDEKPAPEDDEPARLQDELDILQEHLHVLDLAVDIASRRVWELRSQQQDRWSKEQARTVDQLQRLVEEEGGRKNRQKSEDEVALQRWVDETPSEFSGLATVQEWNAISRLPGGPRRLGRVLNPTPAGDRAHQDYLQAFANTRAAIRKEVP